VVGYYECLFVISGGVRAPAARAEKNPTKLEKQLANDKNALCPHLFNRGGRLVSPLRGEIKSVPSLVEVDQGVGRIPDSLVLWAEDA